MGLAREPVIWETVKNQRLSTERGEGLDILRGVKKKRRIAWNMAGKLASPD